MNDENHDLPDPRLDALFAREQTHLPAEPFSTVALRALAAQRRRSVWTKRALQAAGLIALVAFSPLLIAGSAWVAMRLDALAAWVVQWPAAPFALALAAFGALAAVATKWARVW